MKKTLKEFIGTLLVPYLEDMEDIPIADNDWYELRCQFKVDKHGNFMMELPTFSRLGTHLRSEVI